MTSTRKLILLWILLAVLFLFVPCCAVPCRAEDEPRAVPYATPFALRPAPHGGWSLQQLPPYMRDPYFSNGNGPRFNEGIPPAISPFPIPPSGLYRPLEVPQFPWLNSPFQPGYRPPGWGDPPTPYGW